MMTSHVENNIAGCEVQLDGTSPLLGTFDDFVDLYLKKSTPTTTRIYEKVNDSLEICVAIANGHFEHFDQVSFVNNIAAMKGGSHVDYITSQITSYLEGIFNLEPDVIKSYLCVFVNAHICNPAFDSQTKKELSFALTCELSPDFLNKIKVVHLLKRNNGLDIPDIPNLVDAGLANTRYSHHSMLFTMEGESAMKFAIRGLSVIGRKRYGVFYLTGKESNSYQNKQ
ncbi:DNA topoisomerase 2 [Tanacetum coccineum]